MPLNTVLCTIFVGGLCGMSAPIECDDRFPASCALSYAAAEGQVPFPRQKSRMALNRGVPFPVPFPMSKQPFDQPSAGPNAATDLSIKTGNEKAHSSVAAGNVQASNRGFQVQIHTAFADIATLQRQLAENQLRARGEILLAERLARGR